MTKTRKNKLKHTIALSEEAWSLAESLGAWMGISLPDVLEIAVRQMARKEGLRRVPREYIQHLSLPEPDAEGADDTLSEDDD